MNPFAKRLAVPLLIPLFMLLLAPLIAVALLGWCLISAAVAAAVAVLWRPRGNRFLVVYSESAQWNAYFSEEVIPAFGPATRAINLSRDGGCIKKWAHLDWLIYRHGAGYQNRVPIVFRFSRFGTWQTVRFYDAYQQAKKGNATPLTQAKAKLAEWYPKQGTV